MRAMMLEQIGKPLVMKEIPISEPGKGQLLLKVLACGVCRTDLHLVDNELPNPKLPLIPGHQIVALVAKCGPDATHFKEGDRVGVPWLGKSCQACDYCLTGQENLCDSALFTGYQLDGGFAEYCIAEAAFCFLLPSSYSDIQAAPLLCAGMIGYRSFRFAGESKHIGFYGFGAAASLLTQVANHLKRKIYAFTRHGDEKAQTLALSLGAVWAGDSEQMPPQPLDAAILFAPVGPLIPQALKAVRKGGSVICAGIHMSDIPSFPYSLLWGERLIRSVANLTRKDGEEFLRLAPQVPILAPTILYPLEKANEALSDLRNGKFTGTAVLQISGR